MAKFLIVITTLMTCMVAGQEYWEDDGGISSDLQQRRFDNMMKERMSKTGNSPLYKVISTLESMRRKVAEDAYKEKEAYDVFACECKDQHFHHKRATEDLKVFYIDENSAEISKKTSDRDNSQDKKSRTVAKTEELALEHQTDVLEVRRQEVTKWQAEDARLRSNKELITRALASLKESRGRIGTKPNATEEKVATLLQLPGVTETLRLADNLGMMTSSKHQGLASFLQAGDNKKGPDMASYYYHGGSNDIIALIESLKADATKQYQDAQAEHNKTMEILNSKDEQMRDELEVYQNMTLQESVKIQRYGEEIGEAREDLVEGKERMEHEEEMFNLMSADCAHRATLYDQRSKTMKDELKAMVQALRLLTGASAEPKRVQGSLKLEDSELQTRVSARKRRFELEQGGAGKSATVKPHSFLQEELTKQHPTSFLQRSSLEAQKKEALEVLNTEGQKLQSLMLLGLASDSKGSPFEKVKTLIENLIVRLENEAGQEVTKKGFCDTEMAKAEHSRDTQFREAKLMNTAIRKLDAKKDKLKKDILDLSERLDESRKALTASSGNLTADYDKANEDLPVVKQGLEDIQNAVLVLRSFYHGENGLASDAAKVVEKPGGLFEKEGSEYGGQQAGMQSVFALLESIVSDYKRDIKEREEEIEELKREKNDLVASLSSEIKSLETSKEAETEELDITTATIQSKTDDLQTIVDLWDTALKRLETIKPMCVDSGMSYEDRVAARKKEIKALQRAYNALLPR